MEDRFISLQNELSELETQNISLYMNNVNKIKQKFS